MNSNPMLESALNTIFESVIIESPSAYSIGGKRFSVTGATLAASLETRLRLSSRYVALARASRGAADSS